MSRLGCENSRRSRTSWAKAEPLDSGDGESSDLRGLRGRLTGPDADDDRGTLTDAEIQADEDAAVEAATQKSAAGRLSDEERALLDQMTSIAQAARYNTDPGVERFLEWVEQHLRSKGQWGDRRVLVFTEYTATKTYLEQQLAQRYPDSENRVATFDGNQPEGRRAEIKTAFNGAPKDYPLRILLATDAAREGVNLQNYCYDLFHFDVPWNPGRMEQRNGRIDRKLKNNPEVFCYYFVLTQRPEDVVLKALVTKTLTIRRELGVVAPVIARALDKLLENGITGDAAHLEREIDAVDRIGAAAERSKTVLAELETGRSAQLAKQIDELQVMLGASKAWIGLDPRHFRDALSASLELLDLPGLKCMDSGSATEGGGEWRLPDLTAFAAADPSWQATLDTLRAPRKPDESPWEWRKSSPVRPVIFKDAGRIDADHVHLHLEHRVVQRLLGRFLSQGFVHDDLRRVMSRNSDGFFPETLTVHAA